MFKRLINVPKRHSFFLFGARGTGKSTLLRQEFTQDSTLWIDLLDLETEQNLSTDPSRLRRQVKSLPSSVSHIVIDEIQKLPSLLDAVHALIEDKTVTQFFVLTGSSSRKPKAGGANLLAGRAILRSLFPLFQEEIENHFDIDSILRWGTLPKVINSEDTYRDDELRAYASIYLKEEIVAEQLVRRLDPFRKFLLVAAQCNGKIINFSKIASEVGVDTKTVQSYFSILEDTLVGFFLESWHASIRKRLRKVPKFYFFDPGVSRALAQWLRVIPVPGTAYFGQLFEQLVIREIVHRNATWQLDLQLGYLMTDRNVEIDLVIQRPDHSLCLVEIKSTTQLREDDFKNLRHFENDFANAEFFLISRDKVEQRVGKVRALPWEKAVRILTPQP